MNRARHHLKKSRFSLASAILHFTNRSGRDAVRIRLLHRLLAGKPLMSFYVHY